MICSCASVAAWMLRTCRSSSARAWSAFASAALARSKSFALLSATAPWVASVQRKDDALRGVRAVVAVGDEQQADHLAVPDQRHADQRGDAFLAEGVVELGIVREALVVQVVGGRERQPRRHHDAGDAAVTARDHARGSLRQRAVDDEHVELAASAS